MRDATIARPGPRPHRNRGSPAFLARLECRLAACAFVAPCSLAGGPSDRPLIGVDDLAAGGKPDALMAFDLGDRALQVFDAQRLARDHRMQRNAPDPRLFLAA